MSKKTQHGQGERSAMAKWVRAVRGALSQEEAAEKAKVDRSTWADWERDDAPPRWASLQKIRTAFPGAPPLPEGVNFTDGDIMSGPRSSVAASMEGYLDRHGDDITPRERRYLETFAPRQLEGVEPDDAYYRGLVDAFRELQRRRTARGTGGSTGG